MPFKDDAILALGNRLEEVYLKHCDPSIPIHLLSIQMARYSVKKLHMGLRHPSSLSSKMTEEDKEQMIALCVEIVERQITMLRTPSLGMFLLPHSDYVPALGFGFGLGVERKGVLMISTG